MSKQPAIKKNRLQPIRLRAWVRRSMPRCRLIAFRSAHLQGCDAWPRRLAVVGDFRVDEAAIDDFFRKKKE